LHITWKGKHGLHVRQIPFVVPEAPQTVDLQRIALPVNFVPIEVNDLLGYGVSGATVTLYHIDTDTEIPARDKGNGRYEGEYLLDGTYKIAITKEGYKPVDNALVRVANGIVSTTQSFRLPHYVWVTGVATNGEGEGIRDPLIAFDHLRSHDTSKRTDITGTFEVKLEVQEVGTERMYITWKNAYTAPVIFTLPARPEHLDLGEVRLPINFLSILVTDISGSPLQDVEVMIEREAATIQSLKTDLNGSCKTYDLPNGTYRISVKKSGYKTESQTVQVRDGNLVSTRFTLPHYLLIKGRVRDIMHHAVGNAEVIFEEFTEAANEQKLQTLTDPADGSFEQRLLIDNATFLERQKGHFLIKKGPIEQLFTFKIPKEPNQVIHYKTLLFPTNYLHGKVVDSNTKTVPISNAKISLTLISNQTSPGSSNPIQNRPEENNPAQETLRFTTDSLGTFQIDDLQKGEYKITIEKEGYATHEDFIRISGLLQEQEFMLRQE
ncbi:PEGA domain-containing protein, partial [candidate division KSB3 bacterium]|nr:PEGA domain-containing protein [candidate division KSB3 bacterium]